MYMAVSGFILFINFTFFLTYICRVSFDWDTSPGPLANISLISILYLRTFDWEASPGPWIYPLFQSLSVDL